MTVGQERKLERTLTKWFAANANWFVLFVQTYEERRVAKRLQEKLDPTKYVVFVPMKDYKKSKQGAVTTIKVPWLTGYVFLAAVVETDELLQAIKPLIFGDPVIYKLLSNDGDRNTIMLSERDKAKMTAILDENFNIPSLKAIEVGDEVKIIGGVLEAFGGKCLSVNKRKQTAVIEVRFLDRTMKCEMAVEILVHPSEWRIN